MKILYAAGDRVGAQIQLMRFLEAVANKNLNIKIASFTNADFKIPVDWNLEALKDIFTPNALIFKNSKLETYYEQVKLFNPDLIISDLEIYTSYVAILLNKPLWQVSPNLLYHATPQKEKMALGLFKSYPHIFNNQVALYERMKNIIFNSDKRLVYSHFGDANIFDIKDGFEWVRPYHYLGKDSKPCHHNVVACTLKNNKGFIDHLKKYKDVVLFSSFTNESFKTIKLKKVFDTDEYRCNLKNCDIFISQGQNDFIADAYYNKKYSFIIPDFNEQECIVNSLYSKKFLTGDVLYYNSPIDSQEKLMPTYNDSIKFLDEKIGEL